MRSRASVPLGNRRSDTTARHVQDTVTVRCVRPHATYTRRERGEREEERGGQAMKRGGRGRKGGREERRGVREAAREKMKNQRWTNGPPRLRAIMSRSRKLAAPSSIMPSSCAITCYRSSLRASPLPRPALLLFLFSSSFFFFLSRPRLLPSRRRQIGAGRDARGTGCAPIGSGRPFSDGATREAEHVYLSRAVLAPKEKRSRGRSFHRELEIEAGFDTTSIHACEILQRKIILHKI